MPPYIAIRARAIDARHLELLRPLTPLPEGEFEILVPVGLTPEVSRDERLSLFRQWVNQKRTAAPLSDAGRDMIYDD